MAELEKLRSAFKASNNRLFHFRRRRKELIEECAGHRYGVASNDRPKQYVPRLARAAGIAVMLLAANAPRARITTTNPALRAFAFRFQQSLNRLVARINLQRTLQDAVNDAFFGMGIIKCCLADGLEAEVAPGVIYDLGYPSATVVSLDDFVFDMTAQDWRQVKFEGHSYEAPIDLLRQDGRVDKKVLANAGARAKYGRSNNDRSQSVQGPLGGDFDDLEPVLKLWELWHVRENKIYTFVENGYNDLGEKPLAVQDWTGPEYGPYHKLGFQRLPDCTMPLADGNMLYELHCLENRMMRKNSKQAGMAKDVWQYSGEAEGDLKRLIEAVPGAGIRCDNPDGFKLNRIPGVDPNNWSFQMNTAEVFNEAAGNMRAKAGLGPSSDTVGQDKMISEGVSAITAKQQQEVATFTAGVLRDLGYMMWDHEGLIIPGHEMVAGVIPVDMSWRPGQRRGQFIDYQFDVVPFSMPYQSPNEVIQGLTTDMQTLVLPFLDAIGAQGGTLNFQKLMRLLGEYRNRPEYGDLIDWAQPLTDRDEAPIQGPSHQRMKPSVTSRTVTRINRPGGATPGGQARIMSQLAAGSSGQPSQIQSLMRPAG